ncbi:MAG: hypothetical protein ACQEWU_21225 [Bacillota bacterium]|uniref:Uncharacterized protein n=1 Tax=Virgibacillus salarius TaxID=447199 RepID=A0A941E0C0_9BACI|nr:MULTISPECIES: hypothetical protein [Virgibacillus]MBR7797443.1 hypothetical protein [Virgibacillus salarius]MCC2252705.1 hypothetical protein [Virgibacillus sp. AGTR]NAZ10155.1 hypothetical protein [Agaribacter marinus]
MIKIIVLFFSIFVPIAVVFFWFMTYQTKKEEKEQEQEPFYIKIITSSAISFILTLVLMFFIFIVFGSATFANSLLNLDLDIKRMLLISIVIVGYSLVLDHFFFNIIKYIIGINYMLLITISIIRFLIFLSIGLFFSLNYNTNIILACAFVILLLLVDIYNVTSKKKND